MEIDKRLNLVIPFGSEREAPDPTDPKKKISVFIPDFFVHAAPIGRATFERHFMTIARAFSSIYAGGLGAVAAPRVAMMMLRDTAKRAGEEESAAVESNLIPEIRRMTNVVALRDGRWTTLPLDDAAKANIIGEDDMSEAENAVAFFTVASAMHRRAQLKETLEGAGELWGAHVTSLNCTEFAASLPTSTATESSGGKVTASRVPS